MNINKLIERSKASYEDDPKKLTCSNNMNSLVVVRSTSKLKLEPLWDNPIDDREGPIYQQYVKDNPDYNSMFLREEVAERLYKAADYMPEHLKLILRDGHRPVAVQHKLLQALVDKYLSENHDGAIQDAVEYARTFVSDPEITLPPHCCGEAVDVDVVDSRTGRLVDFGCAVNDASEIGFLHSNKISREQYENRITLLTAMLKAGFAPCYVEWWHFTYGDTVWAYFYDQPMSLYGIIEPV